MFGLNSTGKSSILDALLLLKQTLGDRSADSSLVLSSRAGIDLGTFEDLINRHDVKKTLTIEMSLELDERDSFQISGDRVLQVPHPQGDSASRDLERLQFRVSFGYNQKRRVVVLQSARLSDQDGLVILEISRTTKSLSATFIWSSERYDLTNFRFAAVKFLPVADMPASPRELRSPLWRLLRLLSATLTQEFARLAHVGPLRIEPLRTYQFTGDSPVNVGRVGEDAATLLYLNRYGNKQIGVEVARCLTAITGQSLRWSDFQSGLARLDVTDETTMLTNNIKDVGVGVSQVLPILVQGAVSRNESVIILEQPEIHLHPRAQASLADVLIGIAEHKRLLIETHSEHILLRLRRRIAERARDDGAGGPNPTDCSVIFVSKTREGSHVDHIRLTETGDFDHVPKGFAEFFSDDFLDVQALFLASATRDSSGRRSSD